MEEWESISRIGQELCAHGRDDDGELQPTEMETPDTKRGRVIQMMERGYYFEKECKEQLNFPVPTHPYFARQIVSLSQILLLEKLMRTL